MRQSQDESSNSDMMMATSAAATSNTTPFPTSNISTPRRIVSIGGRSNVDQNSNRSQKIVEYSDLASKLAGDVIVACGVTFSIAPIMSCIDKAIVQKAAGTHTMIQSVAETTTAMVRHPILYVKSPVFLMMWGVYATTYCTANCLKTLYEHNQVDPSATNSNKTKDSNKEENSILTGKIGIFAGTTIVNSSTTLLKDKYYAIHFGTSSTRPVPYRTFALWGLRDCMVIGSSFILPEIVSKKLQEYTDMDKKRALQISQFACPVATQLLAGPIQLLGLDLYNRPFSNHTMQDAIVKRMQFQATNFLSIVTARVSRIAPAYGLGGISNTYFRDWWRECLLERRDRHYIVNSSSLT